MRHRTNSSVFKNISPPFCLFLLAAQFDFSENNETGARRRVRTLKNKVYTAPFSQTIPPEGGNEYS